MFVLLSSLWLYVATASSPSYGVTNNSNEKRPSTARGAGVPGSPSVLLQQNNFDDEGSKKSMKNQHYSAPNVLSPSEGQAESRKQSRQQLTTGTQTTNTPESQTLLFSSENTSRSSAATSVSKKDDFGYQTATSKTRNTIANTEHVRKDLDATAATTTASTNKLVNSNGGFEYQEDSEQDNDSASLFWNWCREVMGIETILELRTFDYLDYMSAMPREDWQHDDEVPNVEQFPRLKVRGLAASRHIVPGEVVIRIPLTTLWSVATIIDQDPLLSNVIGPDARRKHGWTGKNGATPWSWLELSLLAVALLHHARLGTHSPMHPFISMLQEQPVDRMPVLWTEEQLRQRVSEGIRTVARDVQREVLDMYETVVQPLIAQHPQLFGPSPDSNEEWFFSLEHFQLAFALVNTRHWQLPIEDLEREDGDADHHPTLEENYYLFPPAEIPSEEWTVEQQQQDGQPQRHSFLAPVADLLNFGPPCTKGQYNRELRSFEIIASCDLRQGQEVTFWYSDECDHIMVGVYGFMHPLIPPCPSAEEYRQSAEEWQARAKALQQRLDRALANLEKVESAAEQLRDILSDCDESCCHYEEEELLYELIMPKVGSNFDDSGNNGVSGNQQKGQQRVQRQSGQDEQDSNQDRKKPIRQTAAKPEGHNVRGSSRGGNSNNHNQQAAAEHGNTRNNRRRRSRDRWSMGMSSSTSNSLPASQLDL